MSWGTRGVLVFMSKEATVSLFVATQVRDEDSGEATVRRLWRVCVSALLLQGKALRGKGMSRVT